MMHSGLPCNSDAADVINNTLNDGVVNNNNVTQNTGHNANSVSNNNDAHYHNTNNNNNPGPASPMPGPSQHAQAGNTSRSTTPSPFSETDGQSLPVFSSNEVQDCTVSFGEMSRNVSEALPSTSDLAQFMDRVEDSGNNNICRNCLVGPSGRDSGEFDDVNRNSLGIRNGENQLETSPHFLKTFDIQTEENLGTNDPSTGTRGKQTPETKSEAWPTDTNENNPVLLPSCSVSTGCRALTPEGTETKNQSWSAGSSESSFVSPNSAIKSVLGIRNRPATPDNADCAAPSRTTPHYPNTPPSIKGKSHRCSDVARPRARKQLFTSPSSSPSRPAHSGGSSSQRTVSSRRGCSKAKKSRVSETSVDSLSETPPMGRNTPALEDSPLMRKNVKHAHKQQSTGAVAKPEPMDSKPPVCESPCTTRKTSLSRLRFGDSPRTNKKTKCGSSKQNGKSSPKNRTPSRPSPGDSSPETNPHSASGRVTPTGGDFPLRVLPQTSEGSPSSDSLPLFKALPTTNLVNYLPFWQNLHVGDLDLDFALRHFHSAADLLRVAGSHVQSLAIRSLVWQTESRADQFVQQVPLYCSNIKEINVDFPNLRESALYRIAQTNRGLQKVGIKRMFAKNLRSLLNCLTHLTGLQELKISMQDEIEIDLEKQNLGLLLTEIKDLLARNHLLHTIKFTFVVKTEIARTLLQHCPTLEHLELNVTKARHYLRPRAIQVQHPNLKTLVLRSKVRFFTDPWLQMILANFPNLKKLEIWGLCGDVSSHLLNECIRKFDTKFV